MKRTIFCYGDSNTYGYDPQSPLGGRYPPQVRWPDQLALLQPDRQIVNFGENGREIPRRPWEVQRLEEALKRSSPVDAVVIMLGSNDLLQMSPPQAEVVVERMRALLAWLLVRRGQWGGRRNFFWPPRPPCAGEPGWRMKPGRRPPAIWRSSTAPWPGNRESPLPTGARGGWSWPLTASTSLSGATWPSPREWTVRCGPWVCNVYKPALVSAPKLRYNGRQPGDTSLRTKE